MKLISFLLQTIETATAIFLTISFGLSVDYSAHVSHAFVITQGHSRNDRMKKVTSFLWMLSFFMQVLLDLANNRLTPDKHSTVMVKKVGPRLSELARAARTRNHATYGPPFFIIPVHKSKTLNPI